MEHEQIMMICQKTSDKKYAKFLSDEGWKYNDEADALAGYGRLVKSEQGEPLTWDEFWAELRMEGDTSAAQKLYQTLRPLAEKGILKPLELYQYARYSGAEIAPKLLSPIRLDRTAGR